MTSDHGPVRPPTPEQLPAVRVLTVQKAFDLPQLDEVVQPKHGPHSRGGDPAHEGVISLRVVVAGRLRFGQVGRRHGRRHVAADDELVVPESHGVGQSSGF